MLNFDNDYSEGAHPLILKRLSELNFTKQPGYGADEESAAARTKILKACGLHGQGEVFFLSGGTQTNLLVLDALLHKTQGVIAAVSGHISIHEAGAIEGSGHKVLTLPGKEGKLRAQEVKAYLETFYHDLNAAHMVQPGAVYISQPTEYGTLYSKAELAALKAVCEQYKLPLYVDGARLAYALSSPFNELSLQDLAALCDVFYIGGTKCGALIGEAVVFTNKAPQFFFTLVKQHGALLAKGFILGTQFNVLFSDDLYLHIADQAISLALKLSAQLKDRGYKLYYPTRTNQIFLVLDRSESRSLADKVQLSFWEQLDNNHDVWRLALSFATTAEQVADLLSLLPVKN